MDFWQISKSEYLEFGDLEKIDFLYGDFIKTLATLAFDCF
jgi:hypothetical protein